MAMRAVSRSARRATSTIPSKSSLQLSKSSTTTSNDTIQYIICTLNDIYIVIHCNIQYTHYIKTIQQLKQQLIPLPFYCIDFVHNGTVVNDNTQCSTVQSNIVENKYNVIIAVYNKAKYNKLQPILKHKLIKQLQHERSSNKYDVHAYTTEYYDNIHKTLCTKYNIDKTQIVDIHVRYVTTIDIKSINTHDRKSMLMQHYHNSRHEHSDYERMRLYEAMQDSMLNESSYDEVPPDISDAAEHPDDNSSVDMNDESYEYIDAVHELKDTDDSDEHDEIDSMSSSSHSDNDMYDSHRQHSDDHEHTDIVELMEPDTDTQSPDLQSNTAVESAVDIIRTDELPDMHAALLSDDNNQSRPLKRRRASSSRIMAHIAAQRIAEADAALAASNDTEVSTYATVVSEPNQSTESTASAAVAEPVAADTGSSNATNATQAHDIDDTLVRLLRDAREDSDDNYNFVIDNDARTALESMGFTPNAVERALTKFKNNIERSTNYIVEHLGETFIDEPMSIDERNELISVHASSLQADYRRILLQQLRAAGFSTEESLTAIARHGVIIEDEISDSEEY